MTRACLRGSLEYKPATPLEMSAFMLGKGSSNALYASLELSCILPLSAGFPHSVDDMSISIDA